VVLNTPTFSGRADGSITERVSWPEVLGADVQMIGIPPAKIFASMSVDETMALFYEDAHLNQNGQDVFTPLIAPLLLKIDASTTSH
jgi:hypothetical protein